MITKKEQKEKLSEIIEMRTPIWLSDDVYNQYKRGFQYYKNTISNPSQFKSNLEKMVGKQLNVTPNTQYGWIEVDVTAKFLVDMWNEGRIISPPSTGQDPKHYTRSNVETASVHFGNMWGNSKGSLWINPGFLNFVMYPDGRTILEATDIEHRLWGIIGGGIGCVSLKSDEKLYFQSPKIQRIREDGSISNSIEVNGMNIYDIVIESNKYTVNNQITIDDVLGRYYSEGYKITLRLLPMYSDIECHDFYKNLNSTSAKSDAQLLHATTYPSNFWAKQISSIKLERFKPSGYKLHPLFKALFRFTNLIRLESLMVTHMIIQYVLNGNYFVNSTDKKLVDEVTKTYGYASEWNSNDRDTIIESVIQKLDILYTFFSNIDSHKISRQYIQIILHILKWIEDDNYVIADWNLFSNSLYSFIEDNRIHKSGSNAGTKTKFGTDLGASNVSNYKSAFTYIKQNFLHDVLIKNSIPESIGISPKSEKIPRLFTNEVIDDSFASVDGIDIDGTPIEGYRVGGHIVSDFELIRMTESDRLSAFKEEGIGDTLDYELNCRAMSSYHNLRMGVLRLSEYLPIINEPDSVIRAKIREKRKSIGNKPILV